MASTSFLSLSFPATSLCAERRVANAIVRRVKLPSMKPHRSSVNASMVDIKTGFMAGVATSVILAIPEIADATQPGMSPSLKDFLLSVVSGGIVLALIVGVVIAVSKFDPVKRS